MVANVQKKIHILHQIKLSDATPETDAQSNITECNSVNSDIKDKVQDYLLSY